MKASDAATSAFSTGARAVTGQMQAFNQAWESEATKKAADTLREIGARIEVPKGEGAAAMVEAARQPGVPAYEASPGPGDDVMRVVPATSRAVDPSSALFKPRSPPSEEAKAAEALVSMKGSTGGRRRKTKKRMTKKRRVTRRSMPTFSY
jgi:hypothetical protein